MSFLFLGEGCSVYLTLPLLHINSFVVEYSLMFDYTSVLFLSVVTWISANVFLFSMVYMQDDPRKNYFHNILLLFVLSMMLLISAASYFSLLVGWDMLGLTSFLLIVYYPSYEAKHSGVKTLMINRVGDVFLIMSFIYFSYTGSTLVVFTSSGAVLLYILASMTKSAQWPFSSWLPAAMAAPTPVSSLVHSSTLVTAGVFLLFRISENITSTSHSSMLIYVGSITMCVGGLSAFLEYDVKKTIAFSTMSQVGLMVVSVGLGAPEVAMFHLFVHGVFKALLFLSAGNVLIMTGGNQDLRTMGGVGALCSVTSFSVTLSCLSLAGLPFISGYYSKHLVLMLFMSESVSIIAFVLFIMGLLFSILYSVRLCYFLVWKKSSTVCLVGNLNWKLKVPLVLLSLSSIFFGWSLNALMWPLEVNVSLASGQVLALALLPLFGVASALAALSMNMHHSLEKMNSFRTLDELYMSLVYYSSPVVSSAVLSDTYFFSHEWVKKSVVKLAKKLMNKSKWL
nr:NADH dehydrogenase subunit 5 [Physella acuta]CAH2593449.1 NADH dehydrogenase subunit 5 [Physella acuta]CAH2593671.1 NADH dehydrogenase subunit 5 [Physella acuta]CAH2593730.1 NADH dehydrogenase subunit 5 [Physella acuta]CAH2594080.1 NADH dehydrogenase subunit 5 [Physella acuta]